MKWIKYDVKTTDKDGNIVGGWGVERLYSEVNEEIAKKEAYMGEYTVEDDGTPEVPTEPNPDERIAALEAELAATKILLGVE